MKDELCRTVATAKDRAKDRAERTGDDQFIYLDNHTAVRVTDKDEGKKNRLYSIRGVDALYDALTEDEKP